MRNKMREWKRDGEETDKEMNELLDRIADLTASNTALRQENMRLNSECHELYEKNRGLENQLRKEKSCSR